MKEHPILFSAPMVRALLAGQKTQTRRIVKPQPSQSSDAALVGADGLWRFSHPTLRGPVSHEADDVRCPYGQPGDRLWVRESFWGCDLPGYGDQPCVVYDDEWHGNEYAPAEARPWGRKFGRIPSIHMPRDCSRITLEIISVRVERLQDISDRGQPNDCIAEGMFSSDYAATKSDWLERGFSSIEKCRYHDLWEQLNGAGSWAANPWVWVVEFRRIKP